MNKVSSDCAFYLQYWITMYITYNYKKWMIEHNRIVYEQTYVLYYIWDSQMHAKFFVLYFHYFLDYFSCSYLAVISVNKIYPRIYLKVYIDFFLKCLYKCRWVYSIYDAIQKDTNERPSGRNVVHGGISVIWDQHSEWFGDSDWHEWQPSSWQHCNADTIIHSKNYFST